MKKIFLYSGLMATVFAMTGCNEDFTNWANPMSNPQLDPSGKIASTIVSMHNDVIKSEDYAGKDTIEFVKFTGASNLDVAQVKFTKLYIGSHEIPFNQGDEDVTIKPSDLDSVVALEYKSLKYTQRDLQVKADISVKDADNVAYSTASNVATVSYMPQDLIPERHKTVENAYYYIGGYNNWTLKGNTDKMTDNGDGSFSILLTVSDGEWFTFAPQSAVDSGNWGQLYRASKSGLEPTSGFFDDNTDNSFKLESGGTYLFTIWPADYYYEVKENLEMSYAGDAYGWPATGCPLSKNSGIFTGYYYVNAPSYGSFKFVANGSDWYGATDGTLVKGGGDNINPTDGEGFYQLVADMNELTYSMTKINQMSLIGSAVNGDSSWGTDYDLTFNVDTKAWEGEFTLTDGEMKIRANHDWSISWGGALDAMTSNNGANIAVTAGKYKISFTPNCDDKGILTMTPAN